MAVADLDGDGHPDVVVSRWFTNTVAVLAGHADGSLGAAVAYAANTRPAALAIADFDGDGRPDVIATSEWTSNLSLFHGQAGGTLGPRSDVASAAGQSSVVAADVNGDGKLDLVVQDNWYNTEHAETMLGNGDGTFAAPTTIPSSARSIVLADLDRDGHPDFIGVNDNTVLVTRANTGGGAFGARFCYGAADVPAGAAVGDLNGDGVPDIVTVGYFDLITVLLATAPLAVGHDPAPVTLALASVGPNPSHGRVSLDLTLPRDGRARVDLIDAAGRRVATLADRTFEAGRRHVDWSAASRSALRPGLYWVRLAFAGETRTVKLVFLD
jgi:hypothetical protein